jgi:SAM-dependent methyltransferase
VSDITDEMADEFDTVASWTADAVAEVGPDAAVPAGCRGSGSPAALRWLAERMGLTTGTRLLDSGAGVGGPAELVARERGVLPTLVEPMVGACRAAVRLFGHPTAAGSADALPFRAGAFDAAWSLGVLCTLPGRSEQTALLRELARVVAAGGPVGLLVFVRTTDELDDQPSGNHFPDRDGLLAMLEEAGLEVADEALLADFPDPEDAWQEAADRVEQAVQRAHGHDERWRVAEEQSATMGRLLGSGRVVGRLYVARQA